MIIKAKPKLATIAKAPHKVSSMTSSILPTSPTSSEVKPNQCVILLIAEPKWGKTHFFMSNPKAVLLAFEEGNKFQRGHKLAIDKWDQSRGRYEGKVDRDGVRHLTAMQAVEALEKESAFEFVIIDTVDMAVKMCSDYFCEAGGKEHPSDLGDYGKGWDKAINTPMRRFLMRILKTGRGVGLITHSKVEVQKFTSGEKARKEMSLGKGPRSLVESQADIIMHGELGLKRLGNRLRDRILVCEGDMDTLAGNRSGTMLPGRYIVSPESPWKQFEKFFTDSKAADLAEREYKTLSKSPK